MKNLLAPDPILLPADPAAAELADGESARALMPSFPASCAVWATLADEALDAGDLVSGYAFARVGYHRGLDLLRRHGWKGAGEVPWSHEPNRGFLRALSALGRAAALIGETDEAERITALLTECDPELPGVLLP